MRWIDTGETKSDEERNSATKSYSTLKRKESGFTPFAAGSAVGNLFRISPLAAERKLLLLLQILVHTLPDSCSLISFERLNSEGWLPLQKTTLVRSARFSPTSFRVVSFGPQFSEGAKGRAIIDARTRRKGDQAASGLDYEVPVQDSVRGSSGAGAGGEHDPRDDLAGPCTDAGSFASKAGAVCQGAVVAAFARGVSTPA